MPESTACRENNTPIWKRHHDANPTLQVVLSNKAKDAIRAASPSHPPGTALTEEAPPQASSDLQPPPPEFSPSEAAPPSPPNYQPSGIDGTETVRTTSGQGREWCQYSSPMRQKAPGSQHVSGKAPHGGPTRAPSASRASCAVDTGNHLRDQQRIPVFRWNAGGKRKKVKEVSVAATQPFHGVLRGGRGSLQQHPYQ